MHGQGQKSEQKPTTKKVVGFPNHSPLLTMNERTGCFGLQETTITKRHTKTIKGISQAGPPKGQPIGTQLYHLKHT